jgi:hypothetical protein
LAHYLKGTAKRMPRIGHLITSLSGRLYLCFCLSLLAAGFYYLATWPIAATDTDLWYHLNGGRYFFETGSIPGTSFFSFIVPERVWVNYYWVFQVLLHQVFSWSGYQGLIFFRTILSCVTLLTVLLFLFKGKKEPDTRLYCTLLFVFYFLLFLPRSLPVRPHLFSYLLIVVFLYVLELGPRWARYLLPPLGALWANLHGIEYPVMLLILGAYFMQWMYERIRGEQGRAGQGYIYPVLLVITAASILCTPHGFNLLAVPFKSIAYVSHYIYELRPLTPYDFMSFFGVLFLIVILTAGMAIRGKSLSVSHFLLLLGGLLLLLKGKRFVNEFALLSLPLLRFRIPVLTANQRTRIVRPVAAVLVVAFMLMPFFFMRQFFANPPRYPLSARELPEGVATFLKGAHATGAILNHPNTGGYLEWALHPDYRIFMDMQVPFLFTDADFRAARDAYTDTRVLQGLILQYKPPFITVPIDMEGFKAMIEEHPQYRIIFFDDAEVLYVDSAQQRVLAEAYEIRSIDPFILYREPIRTDSRDDRAFKELKRLSEIFPDGGIVNASLAALYQHQGRYREAMHYAEAIIRTYPESHLGYKLQADALVRLDACSEAVRFYKKALQRSDGTMKKLIEKEAASCGQPLL